MDKTLVKGLEVLEALAQSESPRGVSDLARELGLTKSNVHRTLQTLCAAGYARQNESSGAYECTMKIPKIAAGILGRIDMKRVAEPFMEGLARATQETVHLSILDDTDVFYVVSGHATFVTGGEMVDPHTTAPNEIRGTSIRNGTTQKLSAGDVVVVPSGVPHWFQTVAEPFDYFVVKSQS